jgi:hypothetical protein
MPAEIMAGAVAVGAYASSEPPNLFDQVLPRHGFQVLVHWPSEPMARLPDLGVAA